MSEHLIQNHPGYGTKHEVESTIRCSGKVDRGKWRRKVEVGSGDLSMTLFDERLDQLLCYRLIWPYKQYYRPAQYN